MMDGDNRRKELLRMLENSEAPVSGTALAKTLGVSRQVIVQDIALLRAANRDILSTARGYLIYDGAGNVCTRCFSVEHEDSAIEEELDTIIDLGGKVLDVLVEHPVYGTISANLMLSNRAEVKDFLRKVKGNHAKPLNILTGGTHFHTVEAAEEETLDRIEEALKEKGFLI